jgi:hypothetical protein
VPGVGQAALNRLSQDVVVLNEQQFHPRMPHDLWHIDCSIVRLNKTFGEWPWELTAS